MGFFDDMKVNKLGRDAYNAHVQANDFQRRGRVADAQKKYDEAYDLYGKAYEAGCRKTGILMSYSVLLMRRGEFELAREIMKEAAQDQRMSEDTHFELRVNYSICLWRLGILDKAIETIQYAGKYRKNGDYYTSLGTFLVEKAGQTGEFEEAKAFLDLAMDYDDEDAHTLCNAGWLSHLLGDDAAAVERLKKADSLNANYPASKVYLAAIARENGDAGAAREYLDAALAVRFPTTRPVTRAFAEELKKQLG